MEFSDFVVSFGSCVVWGSVCGLAGFCVVVVVGGGAVVGGWLSFEGSEREYKNYQKNQFWVFPIH